MDPYFELCHKPREGMELTLDQQLARWIKQTARVRGQTEAQVIRDGLILLRQQQEPHPHIEPTTFHERPSYFDVVARWNSWW
ncbi:hypothetical protein K2Q16_03655 [Patescibacteria group bacterium]|nr:hypothetical protein [Patescibacteria group bacterium]